MIVFDNYGSNDDDYRSVARDIDWLFQYFIIIIIIDENYSNSKNTDWRGKLYYIYITRDNRQTTINLTISVLPSDCPFSLPHVTLVA